MGQLRADVFRDLLLSTGGLEGALAGVRAAVQLQVTIDRSGAVTADRVGAVSPEVLADLLALAARHRWAGSRSPRSVSRPARVRTPTSTWSLTVTGPPRRWWRR